MPDIYMVRDAGYPGNPGPGHVYAVLYPSGQQGRAAAVAKARGERRDTIGTAQVLVEVAGDKEVVVKRF